MDITESIVTAFINLKQKHRFFVSEADFQASFSWELVKVFQDCPNLHISNDYEFVWQDFYEIPEPNGLFKFLLVKIPQKEQQK